MSVISAVPTPWSYYSQQVWLRRRCKKGASQMKQPVKESRLPFYFGEEDIENRHPGSSSCEVIVFEFLWLGNVNFIFYQIFFTDSADKDMFRYVFLTLSSCNSYIVNSCGVIPCTKSELNLDWNWITSGLKLDYNRPNTGRELGNNWSRIGLELN